MPDAFDPRSATAGPIVLYVAKKAGTDTAPAAAVFCSACHVCRNWLYGPTFIGANSAAGTVCK